MEWSGVLESAAIIMDTDRKRVHLFITGDVVGVGFRVWIVRKAKQLGFSGWVKNSARDTVEVVAQGSKDKLKLLIEYSHQGPEVAWVEKVEEKWEEATEEFEGFSIVY